MVRFVRCSNAVATVDASVSNSSAVQCGGEGVEGTVSRFIRANRRSYSLDQPCLLVFMELLSSVAADGRERLAAYMGSGVLKACAGTAGGCSVARRNLGKLLKRNRICQLSATSRRSTDKPR